MHVVRSGGLIRTILTLEQVTARIARQLGAPANAGSPSEPRRLHVFLAFWGASLLTAFLYSLYFATIVPARGCAISIWACTAVVLGLPALLRATRSLRLVSHVLIANTFAVLTVLGFLLGGIDAPSNAFYVIVVLMAAFMVNTGCALAWTALAILAAGMFTFLAHAGVEIGCELDRHGMLLTRFAGLAGLLLYLSALGITLVTLQQRSYDVLEEARCAADSANALKSQFLANMSHEIRTPMTAILGFASELEQGCEDRCEFAIASRQSCIEPIRRNGEHLLRIINDILDLSKIEAGRLETEPGPCDIANLLNDLQAAFRPTASERGLQLAIHFDGLVPAVIMTDRLRLRQILFNLVSNSLKFTERGEVRLTVRLRADAPSEPRLEFSVRDTGPGINPDDLKRLFQPFAQADASIARKHGGSGLGLAISRRLAILLGGDITAQSEVGVGSTFVASVATGALVDVAWLRTPGTPTPLRPAARPAADAPALAGCRVLIVEDGPDNQKLFSRLLRRAGAEVWLVENGLAAIHEIERDDGELASFDLILMDMQMPVLDGYSTTRRLRAAGVRTPILALTAYALVGDREKCLEAGCNDYLSKPFAPATLIERARALTTARAHPSASYC